MLLVLGAGAFALSRRDSGPSFPKEWDARVVRMVEFVERERELTFDHPVRIDFLDEAEWEEQGSIDDEDVTDEDRQLLEHGAGLFRAVGLAEGDLDLLSDTEELGTSGTVGRYSFEEQLITVRGTELSREVEATLVHELTHVLQDQHFKIGERLQRLGDDDTDEGSLRALVEGDADRIENEWVEDLPDEERAVLEEERSESGDAANETLDELPSSLVTFFAADYILGSGFLSILEAADGTSAIDDAFRSPPGPEEHVFDPLSYLEDDEPSDVDLPSVNGEAIEDMDGDFGAVSWFLMLAEQIDPVEALAAVDGWGGDAYRAYTDDDRTCVALRFVGETEGAATTMETSLAEWAAAMPAEAGAIVARTGDVVNVATCDPGPAADVLEGNGRSRETISLVATRTTLATQVLASGGTNDQARCFSSGLLASLGYDLIVDDEPTAAQEEQIQQLATDQAAACR